MKFDEAKKRKIVSSDNLASGENLPLSEVEFGLNIVYNTFSQWTVRCASAAGLKDLTHLDIVVFHLLNRRDSRKRPGTFVLC